MTSSRLIALAYSGADIVCGRISRRRPCIPCNTIYELPLLALLLLVLLMAGAAGCALPVRPGCSPGNSLPGTDALLRVATIAPDLSSSVYIDRTGRSYFSPDYTAWMLSTLAVCRKVSAEDVLALEETWEQVEIAPGDLASVNPERPYLLVIYHAADKRPVELSVRPGGAGQRPDFENAVRLTLAVLERTYGDRFVRELRAAGLQDLLLEPPGEAHQRGRVHSDFSGSGHGSIIARSQS